MPVVMQSESMSHVSSSVAPHDEHDVAIISDVNDDPQVNTMYKEYISELPNTSCEICKK